MTGEVPVRSRHAATRAAVAFEAIEANFAKKAGVLHSLSKTGVNALMLRE